MFIKNILQIDKTLLLTLFILLINLSTISLYTTQTIDLKKDFLSDKQKKQIKYALDSLKILLSTIILIKASYELYIYKDIGTKQTMKIVLDSINILLIIGTIALVIANILLRKNPDVVIDMKFK